MRWFTRLLRFAMALSLACWVHSAHAARGLAIAGEASSSETPTQTETSSSQTPTPTPETAIVDYSGRWFISIPSLGFSETLDFVQSGTQIEVNFASTGGHFGSGSV